MSPNKTPSSADSFDMTDMKEKLAVAERLANVAMMTSPAARRRITARRLEMGPEADFGFVPSRQVLLYLVRMGSFTSSPKIDNTDCADDDILPTFRPCSSHKLLEKCRKEVAASGRPPLLKRNIRSLGRREPSDGSRSCSVRVLQWNILSQALGSKNDNFVKSPPGSLDWSVRRFLILQEIIQSDSDIICLEEVDHFRFFEVALGSIGYTGKFFPKPDSPCLYLEDNNGPDGSAIFFRSSKFELLSTHARILEVWRVQSNQVGLSCLLKEKTGGAEICVAVTHLKAKSGALLATLRDNQGNDLLDWLDVVAQARPIILCGDFNAEPTEPVYRTMTSHGLNLKSAYCVDGEEPRYTTWKIREEGEVCHTIDYIFHSSNFLPVAVLDFPDETGIGPSRVPSLVYPSDHFSLMADLELRQI